MKRVQWFLIPAWIPLIILLLAIGAAILHESMLRWQFNLDDLDASNVGTLTLFGLLASYAFYGMFRALSFNPLTLQRRNATAYRAWLQTTPWRPGKPLPLGPVWLSWQDVVILLPMLPLAALFGGDPVTWLFMALCCLSVPYLLHISGILNLSGVRLHPSVILIALTGALPVLMKIFFSTIAQIGHSHVRHRLFVLHRDELYLTAILLLVLCGWAAMGLQRALRLMLENSVKPPIFTPDSTAWFPALHLHKEFFPLRRAAFYAMLFGLVFYAMFNGFFNMLCDQFSDRDALAVMLRPMMLQAGEKMTEILWMAAIFGAIIRVFIYCGTHWPPLSFFGRLFTGRLLIPAYDKVFIAPLCALLVVREAPLLLKDFGAPFDVRISVTLTLLTFALLGLGPSLRSWHLTGPHRIVRLTPGTYQIPCERFRTK